MNEIPALDEQENDFPEVEENSIDIDSENEEGETTCEEFLF